MKRLRTQGVADSSAGYKMDIMVCYCFKIFNMHIFHIKLKTHYAFYASPLLHSISCNWENAEEITVEAVNEKSVADRSSHIFLPAEILFVRISVPFCKLFGCQFWKFINILISELILFAFCGCDLLQKTRPQ